MANSGQEDHLFAPGRIEWMLSGGLESMESGERQLLLAMAETKLQGGYKPTGDEKKAVNKLRALAGEDYSVQDIQRKVKTMVKGAPKTDVPAMDLPPTLKRLMDRVRSKKGEAREDAE